MTGEGRDTSAFFGQFGIAPFGKKRSTERCLQGFQATINGGGRDVKLSGSRSGASRTYKSLEVSQIIPAHRHHDSQKALG